MSNEAWKPVSFTRESWKFFKLAYERAVYCEAKTFTFCGREFNTQFAKYFIEFHGPKFK